MEAIVPDESGAWYGYYHHERPADLCGRPDRQLPRIGAMRSTDSGQTWEDLGIVLDAPPGSEACDSSNRYVLGGIGDVTAALDADSKDLYLYFSQYLRDGRRKASRWRGSRGPIASAGREGDDLERRRLAAGSRERIDRQRLGISVGHAARQERTAVSRSRQHQRRVLGPSIHWNTYLEQYVMLLNRAKDDQFGQEGIYVSFSPTLADPRDWTAPAKIMNGGSWYPQVIGAEAGTGTDRSRGQARALLHDRPIGARHRVRALAVRQGWDQAPTKFAAAVSKC